MKFICIECNKEVDPTKTSIGDELIETKLCSTCHFFLTIPEKGRVIVKGLVYTIGDENESGLKQWRGFGGRKFTIKMNTGEEIVSTNLNFRGKIPEHLRDRLINNAEFL